MLQPRPTAVQCAPTLFGDARDVRGKQYKTWKQ